MTGDVIQGSAAAVLLRAAENAGLLVVSRGLGGFTGLLLGSVSMQVLHHCLVLCWWSGPGSGPAARNEESVDPQGASIRRKQLP